jgi:hypothetical protein
MRINSAVRAGLFLLVIVCTANPAWAYKRNFRIPLMASHGFYTASGTARYIAKFNEPNVTRYEELTIEVKNVPLVPGTVLVVEIDGETIGNFTLDRRQSGTLTITSETRKYIPNITSGSGVMVKKVDGTIVIW